MSKKIIKPNDKSIPMEKCLKCNKFTRTTDELLTCSGPCGRKWHLKCAGVSKLFIEQMNTDQNICYICPTCRKTMQNASCISLRTENTALVKSLRSGIPKKTKDSFSINNTNSNQIISKVTDSENELYSRKSITSKFDDGKRISKVSDSEGELYSRKPFAKKTEERKRVCRNAGVRRNNSEVTCGRRPITCSSRLRNSSPIPSILKKNESSLGFNNYNGDNLHETIVFAVGPDRDDLLAVKYPLSLTEIKAVIISVLFFCCVLLLLF